MNGIDSSKTVSELKNKLLYFQKNISTLKNEKIQDDLKLNINEKLSKIKFGWERDSTYPLLPKNIDLEKIKDKIITFDSDSMKSVEDAKETKDSEESPEEKEVGDISVGISVASNIIQDGSKTIYSKKSRTTKKSKINVEKLVKNDVKGAITGAIALGFASTSSIPLLTPVAIATGAVGGDIVGSIGASFDQLWDKLFHRSDN